MIASRSISYVREKIEGKDDEEKAKKLVELGIIEKDRKDIIERFISACKLSRNVLSHRAGVQPKPDEALQLVSSAVSLTRYLAEISQE